MGMIAMQMTMNTDSHFGYPSVRKMFAVTSSRMRSPNIRRPATAIARSRKYCLWVQRSVQCPIDSVTYRKQVCNVHTTAIPMGMAHISVNIRKDTMSAPRC